MTLNQATKLLIAITATIVVLIGIATLKGEAKPVWTWRCLAKPEEVTDALNMIYAESAKDAKISTQTYSTSEGYVGTVWCIWYHQ